jgi:hypothetical protein
MKADKICLNALNVERPTGSQFIVPIVALNLSKFVNVVGF